MFHRKNIEFLKERYFTAQWLAMSHYKAWSTFGYAYLFIITHTKCIRLRFSIL